MLQVLIVGDFNIAATQQDVHDKLDREAMYPKPEKELFDSILAEFTDVWRKLHPDSVNTFTVWDEKTSARAFNEVTVCPSTYSCYVIPVLCVYTKQKPLAQAAKIKHHRILTHDIVL